MRTGLGECLKNGEWFGDLSLNCFYCLAVRQFDCFVIRLFQLFNHICISGRLAKHFKKKKEDGIVEEGLEFADDSYINEDEENAENQQK